jgi:uncharacterized metal-binding protein YceD (DUF177 family)
VETDGILNANEYGKKRDAGFRVPIIIRIFAPFYVDIVDKLKDYKVAFKGLSEGAHTFRFTLDRDFFGLFEATGWVEGQVAAEVELVKHHDFIEARARIEGKVKATCDRCLEEVDLPVAGEMTFVLKESGEEEGNGDDFIVLAPGEDYVDLGTPLYELFMLSYPPRVVHAAGECDPEMERILGTFVSEEDPENDPRWNELKKLINN